MSGIVIAKGAASVIAQCNHLVLVLLREVSLQVLLLEAADEIQRWLFLHRYHLLISTAI